MNDAFPLAGLAIANMLGAITPGPAFLMVSRAAAGRSRASALGLATGVTIAVTIWAAAACFGIAALMSRAAVLYRTLQLIGGAYLIWLGLGAWRAARRPEPAEAAPPLPFTGHRGFARAVPVGAMLNLGNPKIVMFFSSIFVTLLPPHAPLWMRLTVIAIVGVEEISWYVMVAFVFSHPRIQAAYRRASRWVERLMGTILIGFGARILVAIRP